MIVIMGTAALSVTAATLANTCGPYAWRDTQADGSTIALWTIPTAVPLNLTAATYVYGPADQGANSAGSSLRGVHASATSVWSSPSGRAPTAPFSLSSNGWAMNDYYEVTASTLGFAGVTLQWDQYRSSVVGPSTFRVDMSIDGGATFTTVLDEYLLALGSWTAKIIPSIPNAGNQGSVMFRFIDTMATGAQSGTCRLDNILIRSDADVPPPIDTDGDGRPDASDNCPTIANPTQADCNGNGIGDACELAAGAPDCNTNTIPDSCELAAGTSFDCNTNTVLDTCDIAGGAPDFNLDTVPDTCQCIADLVLADHQVNGADLGALLSQWGPANVNTVSDMNRDGKVDGADLGQLLASWGPCTN